jgi:hypothetical protein
MVQEEGRSTTGGSISEKLDQLIDKIEVLEDTKNKKEKDKKFKFNKGKGKLKKNYAMIVYIHTNKHVEIKYLKIKNNSIYIKENNIYHPVTSEFILWHKNYPLLFVQEDQIMPIHPDTLYGKDVNTLAIGEKILFALMKQAQIQPNKKPANIGVILIIILVIAGIVGAYFLLKKK